MDSVITSELNQLYNKEKDISTLKRRVRLLLTQAKSRDLKNAQTNTNSILQEAKDLQMAVLKRMEIDSRGDLEEEKKRLSMILCSLAKIKSLKEPAVAANLYSEALIHVPRDANTLLDLAKLYAQVSAFHAVSRIWQETKYLGTPFIAHRPILKYLLVLIIYSL